MLFFNTLLLNILLQQISCEENDTCEFGKPKAIATIIEQMAKPSNGLLKKIGLDIDFSEMFDIDLSSQGIDINQYFYDSVSFGAIFIAFFVILFLYFFIFLILNWCCCCRAKNSKKPKALHIIFHFLGIILLVVSAILIFISSKSVIKAVDNMKNFPKNVDNELDGIFDKSSTTITDTFDSIERNVDYFINILNNFTNWLSNSNNANNASAYAVIPKIVDYNNTFADPNKLYMTNYNKVHEELKSNKELLVSLELMDNSRQPAIDAIVDLANTLIDATSDISETVTNIQNTVDTSIIDVKASIEEFRKSTISDEINELKNSIDGSSLNLDMIEDLCESLYPIINIIFWFIAALILCVAIIYSLIFFCHNCCSRLTACCFPACGLVLNVIIILPGCIFAILFILFNKLCPELEATLAGFITSSDNDDTSSFKALLYHNVFTNKNHEKISLARQLDSSGSLFTNVTEMLLCQYNTPLLDLLNIGFNASEIIKEFSGQLGNSFSLDVPYQIKDKLGNFAENFDVDKNISSNYILLNHTETIPAVQKYNANTRQPADSMKTIINDNEDVLVEVRQLMKNIIGFGSSIVPGTDDLNNQTEHFIENLINEADATLNSGLNSITCVSIKCVYSPFKNMLCVDLLAGLGFWIFSTVLMIIALLLLSITICRRRRSMANNKIQNSSGSESADSINEFND